MDRVVSSNLIVCDAFILRLVRVCEQLVNRQIILKCLWLLHRLGLVLAFLLVSLLALLFTFIFIITVSGFLSGGYILHSLDDVFISGTTCCIVARMFFLGVDRLLGSCSHFCLN